MSATANIRAGRAYVEVTAETSKLKKSLDAAQSRLKDFGRACQGLGPRVTCRPLVDKLSPSPSLCLLLRSVASGTEAVLRPAHSRLSMGEKPLFIHRVC